LTCASCPDWSSAAPNSTDLSNCSCLSGFYGLPSLQLECKHCGDNTKSSEGMNSQNTSCSCAVGYYASSFRGCKKCPTNSSTAADLNSVNSSLADCRCNRGFFGNPGAYDGHTKACRACSANTFNNVTDAFSSSACTPCPQGFISAEGAADISECVENQSISTPAGGESHLRAYMGEGGKRKPVGDDKDTRGGDTDTRFY